MAAPRSAGRERRAEDGLDVVSVRVEDERGVVRAAVLGANAGRTVVGAAVLDRRCVPALHAAVVRGLECDVRTRRDAVSAGFRPDRVQREVVARAAPEQAAGVAFELTLAQQLEAELAERRLVHAATRSEVAPPDADVVD